MEKQIGKHGTYIESHWPKISKFGINDFGRFGRNENAACVQITMKQGLTVGDTGLVSNFLCTEFYNEVTVQMDEIAERILTLKGSPAATMKEYLELSSIQEAAGGEDAKTMVQNLIEDFATLSNEYQEGIEVADAAEDQPTSDMLTGFKADLEKHMWMLRSFLG
ncbi:hypothetical protein G195_000911 [Phytophthora kernoviae 00238/432]|uniref:Ferritin/DPS domain-containing protein n=1 Tax=Phytophthora kernoviae 00238/432 TaxID=1284355 RepID=A0A8J4SUA4_9STRA|nr:hypothetical protein G195_000911 [Phytophthora kernoviae 00238/432]